MAKTQENQTAKTPEELLAVALEENAAAKKQIAALEKQVEDLTKSYQDLMKENELQATVANASGNKPNVVELDGKVYKAVGKSLTMLKDGQRFELLATELNNHKELCIELLKKGSGFLVELETSKSE